MKTYTKLPIPKDSAWERSSIFGMLHWRIRYFFTGIYNIIRWMPTLYHDREWDGDYILKLLQKKIEYQRKYLVNSNRHMDIDRDNRDMTLALNLLERVREEHYALECMDYWDTEMKIIEVPNNPKLKELDFETVAERFDEYLRKYPSSVRAVIKEHGEIEDKKVLCLRLSNHNHVKAKALLFRILKERLSSWWD
jgi:hypothetical protein